MARPKFTNLFFRFFKPLCLGIFTALVLLCSTFSSIQMFGKPVSPKKLIEYGWDQPSTEFVRRNVREMEKKPFNGVAMKLSVDNNENMIFRRKAYPAEAFNRDIQNLRATKFSKFTDNFLIVWSATESGWDWFNESDTAAAEQNIRLFAKAAKAGSCVGIVLDLEAYGASPWLYPKLPNASRKSFQAYQEKVTQKGAQFIKILQAEIPNVRILTLFHLSILYSENPDLFEKMTSTEKTSYLSRNRYGLLPSFINGILEAAAPGTIIIDGNEESLWYASHVPYSRMANAMRNRVLSLIKPENREKYRVHGQIGQSVWPDFSLALPVKYLTYDTARADKKGLEKAFISYYLTPKQKLDWLEHSVYHALRNSDEYVLFSSEDMDWWRNDIPQGTEAAIRAAQNKIKTGAPLGFEIESITKDAQQKCKRGAIKMKMKDGTEGCWAIW